MFLLHSYQAVVACHSFQCTKTEQTEICNLHHVTVSLCTMKTIIFKAHNMMSLFFRGNHFDCSLQLILQQSGEYS